MDPKLIGSLLMSAFVIWAVYRRLRRTFGPQKISVNRLWLRISILTILGGLILVTSLRNTPVLGSLLVGIVCGAALGALGLRHTQFEVTPQGSFYTPHTYIGLTVTALFLGRILYRFLTLNYATQDLGRSHQNPLDAYQKSPVTIAVFGVLVGYYVLFNLGILRKSKTLAASAQEHVAG